MEKWTTKETRIVASVYLLPLGENLIWTTLIWIRAGVENTKSNLIKWGFNEEYDEHQTDGHLKMSKTFLLCDLFFNYLTNLINHILMLVK